MLAITSILHQKSIKKKLISQFLNFSHIYLSNISNCLSCSLTPPTCSKTILFWIRAASKQRITVPACKMTYPFSCKNTWGLQDVEDFNHSWRHLHWRMGCFWYVWSFGNLVSDWPATLCPVGPCPKECRKILNFSTFFNKMQPTNPNARTYVNGTDVETHGCAVTQNTLLKQFIWTVLYIFPLLPNQSSIDCGIWKWKVWSVKCKM